MFIENIADLRSSEKGNLRAASRKLILDALSSNPYLLSRMKQALSRPRIQFLYLHHIFNDEVAPLEALIKELSKTHSFISYRDAVSKILSGSIDKPYIVISSDDGFKNNLNALEVLEEFGISACFFICPSMVGETDFEKIRSFASEKLNFPPVEFMNWDDVDLLQRKGHEIGGHTMSHVNLGDCPADALADEIGGCYEEIAKRCGSCDHFAFPYGRMQNFNGQSRKIVFESGFYDCASAIRGCHIVEKGQSISHEELLIRRDHMVMDWPLKHIMYFIARNARKTSLNHNYFPEYADYNSHQ